MITHLKSATLPEILKIYSNNILIFGSNNCSHCSKLLSKLSTLSEKSNQVPIIFIDGDKFSEYSDIYDVEYYPTIIFIKNSQIVTKTITSNIKIVQELCLQYFHYQLH